uniref:Uncharacterized protein n=1 Tax=Opuntia streptacantha TaxID=393608 RepID=A0A7C9EYX6_OPUST
MCRMAKEVPVTEAEDEVHTQAVQLEGSRRNDVVEHPSPKFDFHQEANVEELRLTLLVENNANIEKAEACAKELEHICSMLKKKHEEAKELLVRALMNNNNLLMLNHPIYEEKIQAVQRFASRLMYK